MFVLQSKDILDILFKENDVFFEKPCISVCGVKSIDTIDIRIPSIVHAPRAGSRGMGVGEHFSVPP